jgi:hypothetical protein
MLRIWETWCKCFVEFGTVKTKALLTAGHSDKSSKNGKEGDVRKHIGQGVLNVWRW